MQTAFRLDALRGSHPIEVPVKDALDVDQIFDAISYLKGSSVIRMLAAHLGLQKFLEGVSNYLKAHAYGNATTNDLWSALGHASGQDVYALMDPWIRKIGYPVLTVTDEPGQIRIKQSRYLSTGDVKPEEDETLWWIPLGLKGKTGVTEVASTTLTVKEDTIRDMDETFYKINVDSTSFYRTNYTPARLASIGKHIDQLSISDKIGLIGDAAALALSGDATTPALLGFLEGFSSEENYPVWAQITNSLGTIKSIFSGDEEIAKALKAFTLKLVNDAVAKVGWQYHAEENYLTGQLRALLIDTAGMNGNKRYCK
jgi:aminopeptidase N